MESKSFRQMIASGEVKRQDAMKILLEDIHEEPGFNLRIEDADFLESVEQLAAYIMNGGTYPALEVRPRAAGGVFVVDGHRRRRALLLCKERGAPVEWVSIVAFTGNDADRTARIITSAEGRALKPLEVALGYRRLANFGLTPAEIATRVSKTRQHVDQLLLLANANTDVQRMVARGDVSAAVASRTVRHYGEGAGQVLAQELGSAKASGKSKVTAGTMQPKALPPLVAKGMLDELDAFLEALPNCARVRLGYLENDVREGRPSDEQEIAVPARALLALMQEHAKICAVRRKQAEKARVKAEEAAQEELAA